MAQEREEGFKITDRRRRDPVEEVEPPAPPAGEILPGGPDERSLAGLFMMLASEAVIALGEEPDPATGQLQPELPHAAGVIDLLVLLREKTEGNRSAEETQVLEELIYDLQLRYVRATTASG
jgi:hypothetical protein